MTTDPLDALREPVVPVDPDPRFAARLRARLERALLDPIGADMTSETVTATSTTVTPSTSAEAAGIEATSAEAAGIEATSAEAAAALALHTVTPYLAVHDARLALDFYVQAFGALRRGEPYVMADGRIGHAELAIGDSVIMLADEYAELGLLGPLARGGVSQSLRLEVDDVDATVERAVRLGAELTRAVTDSPYGRGGVVNDPFGHRWMISREPDAAADAEPSAGEGGYRHGDVGYASLMTPDVDRAEEFYASVLGWQIAPGSEPQSRQVIGAHPSTGLWGAQERSTTFLCFAVADIAEAVRLVRAGGGTAQEPTERPYGMLADCVDDQGMEFAVYEPPEGTASTAPSSPQPGDISYLTIEVPDSGRARAFYGLVLGWQFTPGRVNDGWGVQVDGRQIWPMTGMAGGREAPRVTPMYQVSDIDAAVARVRAAGGRSTDPQRQPYGVTADCTDDQGGRFYLGNT